MTLFGPDAGSRPAPEGPVVRVKAVVAYDGSGYSGFAPQPGRRTVGGRLVDALERVLGHRVELTCAGRTDAGVHAWGQVVSFDAAAERFDADRLRRSLNRLLAPSMVVRAVVPAPEPGFDARFSARSRRYRYQVLNTAVPDPFLACTTWWVAQPLDLVALRLACDPLVGEHDFAAFCRRPKVPEGRPSPSLTRRVVQARWQEADRSHDGPNVLEFWIEANAFCHQMVRSLVGTLVEVGRGRRRAGELAGVLRAGDRAGAGPVAPPHGLCLWEVTY
ncbi:MAG: tRNA pseudouridine(38-40) synthase TruA [Acidimicrobiia bacterium]